MIANPTVQPQPTGALIAIEGGDGTGKGTLISALIPGLREAGFDVLETREPGGTPEGQALRQLLLPAEASWESWAELLLMAAARVQHVDRVIRPAIAAGRIVVTDRFVGSTIAYQGGGRGLPLSNILALHRLTVGDFKPSLTVILDVDPEVGLLRSRSRLATSGDNEGRFERLDTAFHNRVRASYLAQAAEAPNSHVVVDAALPAQQVASIVLERLVAWLRTRNAP
jgi:dTMP kinase